MRNITLLFLILIHFNIFPQTNDTVATDDGSGWLALPYASYAPETEWAFGVAGLYYFYAQPLILEESRLSNLLASFQFTTKKQMMIEIDYDLYFKNDEYRFYGNFDYAKFPFSFYGTGNNTKDEDEESYTPRYFNSENTILKNFIKKGGSGLNAGIKYDFRKDKIIEKVSTGLLASGNFSGSDGGIISGFGFILNWDTRDNTFSTSSGEYIEANSSFYGSYIFSDYNYSSFNFDIRKYLNFPVFDTTHVFAAQFVTNFTSGNVPFYKLPTFGGDDEMRGVFRGRYRDKNAFYLQSEYRFHVIWRIGLAAFAGIGEVAPKISLFSLNELRATYGIGFRFSVIPEETIIARIDFGFSKGEHQLYLAFSEAF